MSIFSSVGGAVTVGPASGGFTYAYNNISTVPAQVIDIAPARRGITFHNPGTNNIYVAGSFVQTTGSDVALVPGLAALGGCFLVPAGGTLTIEGECQKAWQAFASQGTTNPLTIRVSRT